MTSTQIEDIVKGIHDSTYEIETESRLARVGLKDTQDIASILAKYSWLYNLETLETIKEAYDSETEPKQKERLRRIYYYLLDGYIETQTAEIDDRIVSFEMNAVVDIDGQKVPYHNLHRLISEEPDYDKRDRIRQAMLGVVEQTNPDRMEIIRKRLQVLSDEFGYYSYTAYNSEKKRLDYDLLRSQLQAFMSETEDLYRELMGEWVAKALNRRLGEIGSHHFAYMDRKPEYDQYFPKDKLVDTYRRTMAGMGINVDEQSNIHLDTEDRPKKNPRAVCYAPDPPFEVHLVIKPIGGMDDYDAFFHEAGHAQHYGNVRADLDYIYKVIGTSYALTEIYSFLMEFLTMNPHWLIDMLGVPEDKAKEISYYSKLSEFFLLRRYIAKLNYELLFFENPMDEHRNMQLYTDELSSATGFIYPPQNFVNDMDSGYYSADYLRAWITEAMLREHLQGTYGDRWYSNPDAGKFLKDLWSSGESMENEDVARQIGYAPFDVQPLIRQFTMLKDLHPNA